MPRRSFETGWPCPWYYDAAGNDSLLPLPGFERCWGYADEDGNICSSNHPTARRVHGIMDVDEDDSFDEVTNEKRRKKRCVFCRGTDKTYEKSCGGGIPGKPQSIYTDVASNQPCLPFIDG